MSLKLFQGIKQLEEPVPEIYILTKEQYVGEDRALELTFGLKEFKPTVSVCKTFTLG